MKKKRGKSGARPKKYWSRSFVFIDVVLEFFNHLYIPSP